MARVLMGNSFAELHWPQPLFYKPLKRIPYILLYLLGALLIAWPWLAFDYLFAPDQYVHGYNACVLRTMLSDANSYFSSWFRFNTFPEPNLITHWLLAILTQVLPLHLAEKTLVVALAALNAYAFLGDRPSSSPASYLWSTTLALLALQFWFGATWQLGFVNFLIGMAAALAGLTHTTQRTWSIPLWAIAIYFCHPVALLYFIGTVGLRSLLAAGFFEAPVAKTRQLWRPLLMRYVLWFGLPLLLLAAYLLTHSEMSTLAGASPWRLLGLIYTHNDLALYNPAELPFAKLVALLAVVISLVGAVYMLRHRNPSSTLALVGASVILAAIMLVPDYLAGGAYIHQRLMPILFIWGLYCTARFVPAPKRILVPALCALGILFCASGLTIQRLPVLAKAERLLDELQQFANVIPARSSVLPAAASSFGLSGDLQLSPKPMLHHFAAVIPCERELVLLDNYEAFVGYFPLQWQPNCDPFAAMTRGVEAHPLALSPTSPDQRRLDCKPWFTNHVDYLLAMGPVEQTMDAPTRRWVLPLLHLVAESPQGNFSLYRIEQE